MKTTVASLDDFKVGAPWNHLTKSFQDAVDICRRLNIDFLWIDALCIIQDSENDWKEEAAKMADIYENAFLTIAATKSKEGLGGCYTTTKSEFLAHPVPGHNTIYVRKQPPGFPTNWTGRKSDIWPLLNRGWVYQEMRLSRRVLHFCSQEVMWECRAARKSESGCSDGRRTATSPHYPLTRLETSWRPEDNGDYLTPQQCWYETVEGYSELQLTFEKDKMPALAALTQRMENLRPGDRFLAGLWERTLLPDLLWSVSGSQVSGRPETWRAPSRSWASIQSPVKWESVRPILTSVRVIRVIDVRYNPVGPTHMGKASEASITLRTPLIEALIDGGDLLLNDALTKDIVVADFSNDYDFDIPGENYIHSST